MRKQGDTAPPDIGNGKAPTLDLIEVSAFGSSRTILNLAANSQSRSNPDTARTQQIRNEKGRADHLITTPAP